MNFHNDTKMLCLKLIVDTGVFDISYIIHRLTVTISEDVVHLTIFRLSMLLLGRLPGGLRRTLLLLLGGLLPRRLGTLLLCRLLPWRLNSLFWRCWLLPSLCFSVVVIVVLDTGMGWVGKMRSRGSWSRMGCMYCTNRMSR